MLRTSIRFVVAVVATIFFLAAAQVAVRAQDGPARPALRTWTSTSGHTTKATFDSFDGERVRLKKEDGSFVRLELDKLSDADRQYVTAQTNGRGQSEEGASGKASGDGGETSEFLIKCNRLAEEIAKNYQGRGVGGKAKIAVVEFSDLNGDVTDFGRLLSEELITKLSTTGNYTVVERLLLNKAIAEHKLQLQGIVDPKSAKELGKILGVDAIVSGTVAPMGDSLRVNARVISTETGEVLSSAAVSIANDGTIDTTPGKGPKHAGGSAASANRKGQPVQLPFREDFSGYENGDETGWGPGGKVRTGADGRRWLMPSDVGQKVVGRDVRLPENAYIEIDYDAREIESTNRQEKVLSGIALVDETGAKYRMELVIHAGKFDRRSNSRYTLTLPGGTSATDSDLGCDKAYDTNTIIIKKTGDRISVRIKGPYEKELTGSVSDFKKFTRLELDLYKGPNSTMAFTNIKIGNLSEHNGTGPAKKVSPPRK